MRRVLAAALVAVLVTGTAAWGQGGPTFDIEGYGGYGTPAKHGGSYDPWESYRDLEIKSLPDGYRADCSGISDTLNPPEDEGSGNPVIKVVIAGEPAEPGDYTRNGCQMWFSPRNIHNRLGPGSIGVRVDWPMDQSMAFTIRAKLDGRNPQAETVEFSDGTEAEVTPTYIPPEPEAEVYIGWDGHPVDCDPGTVAVPAIVMTWPPSQGFLENAEDYIIENDLGWKVTDDGQWTWGPITVYACEVV